MKYIPHFSPWDGWFLPTFLKYFEILSTETPMMSPCPAEAVERKIIAKETVKQALECLTELQLKVIILRNGLGKLGERRGKMTLIDVAKELMRNSELHFTPARIRQIEESALLRLRRVVCRMGFFDNRPYVVDLNIMRTRRIPTDLLGDAMHVRPWRRPNH